MMNKKHMPVSAFISRQSASRRSDKSSELDFHECMMEVDDWLILLATRPNLNGLNLQQLKYD